MISVACKSNDCGMVNPSAVGAADGVADVDEYDGNGRRLALRANDALVPKGINSLAPRCIRPLTA